MIGLIIPAYGPKEDLEKCIEAVRVYEGDGTEYALPKVERVIIDNTKENRGFTKAINEGIRSCRGKEFVWILNCDTAPIFDALTPMVERMRKYPKCGIIGSKTLFMDNPDRIHHGGTVQAWPNGVHKTGLKSLGQLNVPTREKWVTFCSVLIRMKMVEEIGLLDEHMFNFCSDADYCYRARYAGWEVWYEPRSEVLHKIGESAHPSEEQQKIMFYDMVAFRNKWIGTQCWADLDREVFDSGTSEKEERKGENIEEYSGKGTA